jgi:hypothetical protein
MKRVDHLKPEFVRAIPERPEPEKLYVSIDFATTLHLCCCGCGNEVVAPLSRTDWSVIYNGESVSLHPSIGNWSFQCRSHYWVKQGRIEWAPRWSQEEVERGRSLDRLAKGAPAFPVQPASIDQRKPGLLERIARRLGLR